MTVCIVTLGALGPRASSTTCSGEQEAAERSPADSELSARLGWCLYRSGEFQAAAERFERALERRPESSDARIGLSFARMQKGDVLGARTGFREVLRTEPRNADARQGLALAALRAPTEELRFGRDADPERPMSIPARARRDYLELREPDGRYVPIFVKGMNLGTALPGKFPTEFPRDVGVYLSWLDTIAGLGANAVRVYTLMPPEFYRAIATHNALDGARKLWLVQGVWAELPESGDFASPEYVAEFHEEIARVVDAIHGDLVAPQRPGHAHGIYDADASESLLAYIVGREWEPFAVKAFDAEHPSGAFQGKYFSAPAAPAMELWVAALCEFTAAYEARRYRTLHPVAFANWPTLDPLRHVSESDREEEDAWRARYGIPFPEAYRDAAWENDAVSLDATKIVPTAAMAAGFFAAYHIYPNYPDFLNLEAAYGSGRDAVGASRYAAYLDELKRYHGRQPVLVAEFGISTSRGVAHVQPEGWSHGGHDERRQGELIGRMMGAIHEKGYAGGIVFELMDEWFKGTWSVGPLTIPAERRRLWFNAESPEQSYGVIANRPREPVRVDGDPSDWAGTAALTSPATSSRTGWSVLRELRASSDEGYLYLLLRTAGGPAPPDWAGTSLRVAIDTYDRSRGLTRLPEPGAATIATGAEFLIELVGPGASFVKVVAPYEPYRAIETGPVASPAAGTATELVHLAFETNRERIGRDGIRYPAVIVDRGALLYGSLDPAADDYDTRAEVAVGAATGTVELRIPWGLLNVSDPSSRRVIHQEGEHAPPLDTVVTEGFRLYAFGIDRSRASRKPVSRIPAADEAALLYTWPTWEVPRYRTGPKRGVDRIRAAWRAIPDRPEDPADAR